MPKVNLARDPRAERAASMRRTINAKRGMRDIASQTELAPADRDARGDAEREDAQRRMDGGGSGGAGQGAAVLGRGAGRAGEELRGHGK